MPGLLQLGVETFTVDTLDLDTGTSRPTRARLTLGEALPDQDLLGKPAFLSVGDEQLELVVKDFLLPLDREDMRARLLLVDRVSYRGTLSRAVFSAPDGVSFGGVLESAGLALDPGCDVGVFTRHGTLVVDGSLWMLLDDLLARLGRGEAWATGKQLLVGASRQPEVDIEGRNLRRTPRGLRCELAGRSLPPLDRSLRIEGHAGVPKRILYRYDRRTAQERCHVELVPACGRRRRRPRGEILVRGDVTHIEPFTATLDPGEVNHDDPARASEVRTAWLRRSSDLGRFCETLPLRVGDSLRVVLPCGGVHAGALPARPESEASPEQVWCWRGVELAVATDTTFAIETRHMTIDAPR